MRCRKVCMVSVQLFRAIMHKTHKTPGSCLDFKAKQKSMIASDSQEIGRCAPCWRGKVGILH
jgi:hypothetical protein